MFKIITTPPTPPPPPTLSFRREIQDHSFIFNCFHEKFNCNYSNFIKLVDIGRCRRVYNRELF